MIRGEAVMLALGSRYRSTAWGLETPDLRKSLPCFLQGHLEKLNMYNVWPRRMDVKDKEETFFLRGWERRDEVWGSKSWILETLLAGGRGRGFLWLPSWTCLGQLSLKQASSDDRQPSWMTVSQGIGKVLYYLFELPVLYIVWKAKVNSHSCILHCLHCHSLWKTRLFSSPNELSTPPGTDSEKGLTWNRLAGDRVSKSGFLSSSKG